MLHVLQMGRGGPVRHRSHDRGRIQAGPLHREGRVHRREPTVVHVVHAGHNRRELRRMPRHGTDDALRRGHHRGRREAGAGVVLGAVPRRVLRYAHVHRRGLLQAEEQLSGAPVLRPRVHTGRVRALHRGHVLLRVRRRVQRGGPGVHHPGDHRQRDRRHAHPVLQEVHVRP